MSDRLVNCPQCGAQAAWRADNPWRPFCSAPCKALDLGAWASESYRIPVVEFDDIDEADVLNLSTDGTHSTPLN